MPPGKFRWTQEGDDAAVLAQAILSGTVTSDLKTFNEFFDPDSAGPGAAIGQKFDIHLSKGKRNLQLNYQKLLRKIGIWQSNRPDPKTGKGKF